MIKNYLKILTLFLGVLFTQSVNAAYETGEATEYKITVLKIFYKHIKSVETIKYNFDFDDSKIIL